MSTIVIFNTSFFILSNVMLFNLTLTQLCSRYVFSKNNVNLY